MTDDINTPIDAQDMLASGASYRKIDHWWRRGYFARDGETPASPGTGYPRDWTLREFKIAALIVRFTEAGVEVSTAADWARDAVDKGTTTVTTPTGITVTWQEPQEGVA